MTDIADIRHSKAENAAVVSDKVGIAKREAANALHQAVRVRDNILTALDGKPFKLRPSTILDLNRCAIDGLDSYAGVWRPAGIEIGESQHTPPGGHLVPELVEEMCDYVNDNWTEKSAVHLASFIMWRLNWIHPFTEGNGRTSRATSYLVLSVHSEVLLPGRETIPEQIVSNRDPYYEALEDADEKYKNTNDFPTDIVERMEMLMKAMLAKQLKGAFDAAVGLESEK